MSDVNEIKAKLDVWYKNLKGLKNISAEDANEVVGLLTDLLMYSENIDDVAYELFRFQKSVFYKFFKTVIKNTENTEQIESLLLCIADSKKFDHRQAAKVKEVLIDIYVKKHELNGVARLTISWVKKIWLAGKISQNERINQIVSFINKTHGRVYEVDYSDCDRVDMGLLYKVTLDVYHGDIDESAYSSRINEWIRKYGIEASSSETKKEETLSSMNKSSSVVSEMPAVDKTRNEDGNSALVSEMRSIADESCRRLMQSIASLRSDLVVKERIKQDNEVLKTRTSELEKTLASKVRELAGVCDELSAVKTDLNGYRQRVEEQSERIAELSRMNSRDNEQAVLVLKNNLKTSLQLCYETWLSCADEGFEEETFETLRVVMKRIFKELERNGISFEE